MDSKLTALSMIVHGDTFWINIGRALQVASPDQAFAIEQAWPNEYRDFEQSARRIPYEYKVVCQLELVLRDLKGSKQTWKAVVNKATMMGFHDLVSHLDMREKYRTILTLARRYGVSQKETADLVETAVS